MVGVLLRDFCNKIDSLCIQGQPRGWGDAAMALGVAVALSLRDSLSHDKFIRLSASLWAIWTSRRKAIHEGIFQTPQVINSFINRFIDELELVRVEKASTW